MSSLPSHELTSAMDIPAGCNEITYSNGLNGVMDLLLAIDISSHMEAPGHGMEELKVDRPSAVTRRP